MRFKTKMAVLLAWLGLATVMASGSLVLLTSWLTWRTSMLGDAVESVRLAETAVQDLLLLERAEEDFVHADVAARIERSLRLAHVFVTSADEAAELRRAEEALARYLAAPAHDPALYAASYDALRGLAAINVEQARRVRQEAERLDRLGTVIGVFCAVAVPAAIALALVGADRALRPVFALGRAMERFAAGERDARAPLDGPVEVRDMAARFNAVASTLARQEQAQLAFVAGVAHDLRNPLLALRLAATAARRPDADAGRLFELVSRQVDHLERMVGDLLDVARIQAGRFELDARVHDLREVVRGVVDLFAASGGDRLALRLPGEPVLAHCDAARLAQVVTNLVSNALKYSPDGAPVEVSVAGGPSAATVEVRDHGIGIPPAEREAVFEPFRRGDGRHPRIAGVGMGLYVARRLVEAHGGRIEVRSEAGVGSTFRVEIPLVPPTGAPLGWPAELPCPAGRLTRQSAIS